MNKLSLVLTMMLGLAMVIVIAPNILAMNRGKTLRNIALWLAIFLGLVLIYKNFSSEYGFDKSSVMSKFNSQPAAVSPTPTPSSEPKDTGNNYTPPKE